MPCSVYGAGRWRTDYTDIVLDRDTSVKQGNLTLSGEAEPGVSQTDTMQQGEDHAEPQGAARNVTIPTVVHSFMAACRSGNIDRIKFALHDRRVDMNCRGLNGMTSLMVTAVCGRLDAMKFLVEKGANPTLVDDLYQNVLHLASMRGDVESVKYILSLNKVDINAKTKQGWTATDWASYWNHTEVENILLSTGAEPSQIYPAETLQ